MGLYFGQCFLYYSVTSLLEFRCDQQKCHTVQPEDETIMYSLYEVSF